TRELIEDGAGWLVPVGDADQLARALSEVVAAPEEARARGRRGRQKVLEGYNQESILRLHEELYARALESQGHGAGVAEAIATRWPPPPGAPPRRGRVELARGLKRAIDLAAAAGGLLVLAPLLALLALVIRLNMGRPAFFRQRRPGLGGVPFVLVKFRTMR